jgi:hypothetical protein
MASGTNTPGFHGSTPNKTGADVRNSPKSDAGISPRTSDELDHKTLGESSKKRLLTGDNEEQSDDLVIPGPGNKEYVVKRRTDCGITKVKHTEEARHFIENNWTDDSVCKRDKPKTLKRLNEKPGYRIDYQKDYESSSDQPTYAIISLQTRKSTHASAHVEVDVKFGSEVIQQALCRSLELVCPVSLISRQCPSAVEPAGRKKAIAKRQGKRE